MYLGFFNKIPNFIKMFNQKFFKFYNSSFWYSVHNLPITNPIPCQNQ